MLSMIAFGGCFIYVLMVTVAFTVSIADLRNTYLVFTDRHIYGITLICVWIAIFIMFGCSFAIPENYKCLDSPVYNWYMRYISIVFMFIFSILTPIYTHAIISQIKRYEGREE